MNQWFVMVYWRETSFSGLGFPGLLGVCMTLSGWGRQCHKDAVGWKGSSFFSVKQCKGDVKDGLGAL